MEAVEQLPTPKGIIGSHHIVEVSSLERQDTSVVNGVLNVVKLERIEFELVERGRKMWKFVGDIDLNERDERDTEILQLLMDVLLGAKGIEMIKHTPLRATVTALFRKRPNKHPKRSE
ncbi:MAG TPA: hypothetical protein VIK01_01700 [Polyangiaceae bacterium]